MAGTSGAKVVIGGVAVTALCVARLVVTAYGVTTAYLMGAAAQSDVDNTTTADPRVLLRSSFQQLLEKLGDKRFGTIFVDEEKVEVHDAKGDAAEVVDVQ